MPSRCCIVIPTYNERENISALLPRVLRLSESITGEWRLYILIVDDNSPDDTSGIVRRFMRENKGRIFLLERRRRCGLGSAYKDGFKYAMEKLKADVIVEMDGDLSHNPSDIPRLLKALSDGSDLAIGSRYIAGGSIEGWSWKRKLISMIGNGLPRLLLKLNISDCTSGFRAIRTDLLSSIMDEIDADGYAFQIDMIYHAVTEGARISEVPIYFKNRKAGKSKLRLKDILEFIWVLLKLRFKGRTRHKL